MADDSDFDWGDDPFTGDLDFDDNFDSPRSKKGFIRSAATGFLSGLVGKTIGDTDARINTLKMVLPNSYLGAFSNLRAFNEKRKEILAEIKDSSHSAVEDLQYLARRAAKKLAGDTPNKISDGLLRFSEHDISHWEKQGNSVDGDPTLDDVNEEDVKALLANEDANGTLNRQTADRVGKQTIEMMTEVGGRTVGGLTAISTVVTRSNQILEQLLSHQRRVQARNDNMQLNILARTYLTNAKFYKFVEASNHRIIDELRDIGKFSQMSDYEKTSHSQALRKTMRESFFNTAKTQFGGIGDWVKERFGKDARESGIEGAGGVIGSLRMAAEMSEGSGINLGGLLGNAAAGAFIDNLPRMIGSNKGQEYVRKFKKQFPSFSKWADDAYKRIEDLGHVASYSTSNAEGLMNTLAHHYKGGSTGDEADTYDDYVAKQPSGKPVMGKNEWTMVKGAKSLANKGLSTVFADTWGTNGTTYSLTQRKLSDSFEREMWTKRSDRTLNEEIPQWLSQIHLSLEKQRTGDDSLKGMSYDYIKAGFVTNAEKVANATNKVFDHRQFSAQAEAANNVVENIDELNALSPEAKRTLAYKLIRDVDKRKGFSPYNYMSLDDEDETVSPKVAAEIKQLMQGQYGITDDILDSFNNGSDVDRALKLTYMPTEKGRAKVRKVNDQTGGLANFTPELMQTLDILKGNGQYDALKEAGIIAVDDYGRDDVNMSLIHEEIKKYIADPTRRSAIKPAPSTPGSTRPYAGPTGQPPLPGPLPPPAPTGPLKVEGMDELLKSMTGLNDIKSAISGLGPLSTPTPAPMVDLVPLNTGMETLNQQVVKLLEQGLTRNELLTQLLERQPAKSTLTPDQEDSLKKEKRSIIDRLKETSFRGMFNKGIDAILDNEPLILGGLLGGLATVAFHNPKAAALIGGGAAIALGYGKLRSLAASRGAKDTDDLYEEGSDIPVLEANKLQRGDYLDMTTGFILESWSKIKGSVKDITTDTIIGARRLAGKLFTADNKEVFLQGLSKLRDMAAKAFKLLDPFGRVIRMKDAATNRFFQMDVYKEGEDSPVLSGKSFAGGAYYRKDSDGALVELKGWNEIDGPVYDREGSVLITQDEYDRGLRTSMGVSINKLGAASRRVKDAGLGILGKLKNKAAAHMPGVKDKVVGALTADYSPIVSSVDRIYNLMLKHWGYSTGVEMPEGPEDPNAPTPPVDTTGKQATPEPTDAVFNKRVEEAKANSVKPDVVSPEVLQKREQEDTNPKADAKNNFSELLKERFGGKPKEERLNSASDKKRKAAEKKDGTVKDAIISIAKNFGFGEKEDKKKPKGLLGLLMSGFGLLTSAVVGFGSKMLSSFSLLGRFAMMGLRTLPMIATGIAALTKGILTLLKTKSLTGAAESIMDSFGNGPSETTQERRRNRRTPRGRMMGGGVKMGAGLAVGAAASGLVATGLIDDGGIIDTAAGVAGTAATLYGGYQLATGAAAAAGVNLGIGSAVSAGVGAVGTALGGAMSVMAPLLLNPITLGALAVGAVGYGLYKYATRGKGKQTEVRMVQYGVPDHESDLALKILKMEELLTNHVVIGNGRASLSKDAPLEEAINLLLINREDKQELNSIFTWFNGRFKPVFMTYMACLDAVKIKSLKDYDENSSQDTYKVAKQTHQALSGIMPFPYSIVAKIDPDTPLLGEKATVIRVNNLLMELKAYVDRKTPKEDLAPVPTLVGAQLGNEKARLEEQLKDPKAAFGEGRKGRIAEQSARTRLAEIDRLNSTYKAGTVVGDIYIKDLLPEGKAMDLLTAIRVACYGNDEDIPWRVEAVLKLERYCEPLFVIDGDKVSFKGNIGDLFGQFRDAFRLGKDDGEEWCLWFRDRFIPVMQTYVGALKHYRRGNPGVVWKTLSVTAKYEVARALIETKLEVTKAFIIPVWNVRAAPFKGARSPSKPDKVDRLLTLLGEASVTAKLKNPEVEAGKTSASSWATTVSPHKVGGGFTEKRANIDDVSKAKTRRDVSLAGQYGTSSLYGAGNGATNNMSGVYKTPTNQYGYAPLNGDSDTSHLDLSGVKTQEGTDKGVKVPRKLAEQLIIREMLKQGFTDPREIAQMLAHTNVESGGYAQTTENMKYSSPERLVKLFREVKSLQQAKQLVDAGEVAIANTVYGGGKGQSLGNTEPGDGYKYRGRGFVHITGKNNYAKVGQSLGIDLVNHPELASNDPNVMAAVAVDFFKNSKALRSISKTGDFGAASLGMNGNGSLPEMPKRYSLYLDYLKQLQEGKLKADETGAAGVNTPDESTPSTPPVTPAPMIGGNTPPMGAAPGGGSVNSTGYSTPMLTPNGASNNPSFDSAGDGGGGYSGGGATGGSLVKSNTSAASGLRLKSAESVGGGDSHPGITRLCQLIQSRVQYFKEFTALNDRYHQGKPGGSKHKVGLAADFTLTNGIRGSDLAVRTLHEILGQAGMTAADFLVINEYRKRTANGTGGHVHIGFKSPAAAAKFAQAAGGNQPVGEDTTTGGTVSPKDEQPDRSQPVAPPSEGYTVPPGSDVGDTATPAPAPAKPAPQAPEQRPKPEPVQPPAPQPAPAPAPQPTPVPKQPAAATEQAPAGLDLSGLSAELSKALAEPNQVNAALLKGILTQVTELVKVTQGNKPAGPRVNLG